MYNSHTNTKLNCAYIFWDICRILKIGQNVVDGVANSVNFRNSDWVTTRVDCVESVDSGMCGKHAVSNFGASIC